MSTTMFINSQSLFSDGVFFSCNGGGSTSLPVAASAALELGGKLELVMVLFFTVNIIMSNQM
jgi:hypothetical protein